MKPLAPFLIVLSLATHASAQTAPADSERLSVRAVGSVAAERFSAGTAFEAVSGSSVGALFGGGVRVTYGRVFGEVSVSRYRTSGQRAFVSGGESFQLDIPLTVTLVPVEIAAGYRFKGPRPTVTPYIGAGVGVYRYTETSPAADPGEEVSARNTGWLALGGLEFRIRKWMALGAELQYSHVPGILGSGGLSLESGEANVGGVTARFKIILGR
jgi:opacity protein-like surface antigen